MYLRKGCKKMYILLADHKIFRGQNIFYLLRVKLTCKNVIKLELKLKKKQNIFEIFLFFW